MCASISYNGMLYYMGRLPGNIFENIYLTSVMDTSAYLLVYFLIERFKRRGKEFYEPLSYNDKTFWLHRLINYVLYIYSYTDRYLKSDLRYEYC